MMDLGKRPVPCGQARVWGEEGGGSVPVHSSGKREDRERSRRNECAKGEGERQEEMAGGAAHIHKKKGGVSS